MTRRRTPHPHSGWSLMAFLGRTVLLWPVAGLGRMIMFVMLPALLVQAVLADRHLALPCFRPMRRVCRIGTMAERCRIAVLRHIGLALERAFELFAGFAGHGASPVFGTITRWTRPAFDPAR